MSPQELREYLFAHTPGEVRNRGGESYSFGKYAARTDGGHPMLRLTNDGREASLPVSIDAGPGILVKKNSRFQEVPSHSHEWIELNYVYAGNVEQHIGGQSRMLRTHQVSLIDVNTTHALGYTDEGDILINLLIPPDILDYRFLSRLSSQGLVTRFFVDSIQHRTQSDHFLLFPTQANERLAQYMELFLCEYYEARPDAHDVLESLFLLILTEMVRSLERAGEECGEPQSEQVVAVLRYIEDNIATCTLKDTASHFGLSPNYLTALLKARTGSSYKELVVRRRLITSANMLRATDLPVEEVARQVGYENVGFFYRKFKAEYGVTPTAWRKG